jgi:gamma-glutamyltranspeptidase
MWSWQRFQKYLALARYLLVYHEDHYVHTYFRPLSSTSASVIFNTNSSSIYGVFGGSGGSRIFPSLAQVILNLECGLNLSEAIERPRVHNQIIPDLTTIELGPEGRKGQWGRLIKDLEKRGHKIGEFDINLGVSESECARFVIFVVGRGTTAPKAVGARRRSNLLLDLRVSD